MSKKLLAKFRRDKFLTVQICNLILIAHLDGAIVDLPGPHSTGRRVTRLLIDRELLELATGGTIITELGRWALAEILAQYTEALLAAHTAEIARKARKVSICPPHLIEIPQENSTLFSQK